MAAFTSTSIDTLIHTDGRFLLADTAMAHALLDNAEAMQDADRAQAEIDLARVAMHAINRNLVVLNLAEDVRRTVEASRDALRARILSLEGCASSFP